MATQTESESGQPITETPDVIESSRIDEIGTDDLTLITDRMEVDVITGYLGIHADYDGALVKSAQSDYTEVWLYTGAVAYDHTKAYRYV